MSDVIAGLEGVVCLIDDLLVYGQTQEEHDQRLVAVLDRIKCAGATLNAKKCEFSKSSIKFLGQIVDAVNASQRSPTPEGTVRTRSGRISIPPDHMNPTWQ